MCKGGYNLTLKKKGEKLNFNLKKIQNGPPGEIKATAALEE